LLLGRIVWERIHWERIHWDELIIYGVNQLGMEDGWMDG
jgi:hypothetical protein